MSAAPLPENETERLDELKTSGLLDTLPEQAFDDITFLAAQITTTPIALVSLVDEDRQWFKSRVGLGISETPRSQAFCGHAILEPDTVLIVPDATADLRFADNPLVTGELGARFYAGVPLVTASGNALGTLCVLDHTPRGLSETEERALRALSRQVIAQIELRQRVTQLADAAAERELHAQQLLSSQERLETALVEVTKASVTDSLTGLKNRRALVDKLEEERIRSSRYDTPLAVLLIDIDNFKMYNDLQGHRGGDAALKQVAKVLSESCRAMDFPARFGGDEFVVVLPNANLPEALPVAERIQHTIQVADWHGPPLTVSIGAASDSDPSTDLIVAADAALYRAKHDGRNQVASTKLTTS